MPPARQQCPNRCAPIAIVDEEHDSSVLLATDHASGGLHHFANARIQIRVVITLVRAEVPVHRMLDPLVDGIHLRQPQRGDERADQAPAGQIHAFGKHAAEHGEADAPSMLGEARQKIVPPVLVHARRLSPQRQLRMGLLQAVGDLPQVVEAAEEAQIIARLARVLLRHQVGDRAQ